MECPPTIGFLPVCGLAGDCVEFEGNKTCVCYAGWSDKGWVFEENQVLCDVPEQAFWWIWSAVAGVWALRTFLFVLNSRQWRTVKKRETVRILSKRVFVVLDLINGWVLLAVKFSNFWEKMVGKDSAMTFFYMNHFGLAEAAVLQTLANYMKFLLSLNQNGKPLEQVRLQREYDLFSVLALLGYAMPCFVVGNTLAIKLALQASSFVTVVNVFHSRHVLREALQSLGVNLDENQAGLAGLRKKIHNAHQRAKGLLVSNTWLGFFFITLRVVALHDSLLHFFPHAAGLTLLVSYSVHCFTSLRQAVYFRSMEASSAHRTSMLAQKRNSTLSGVRVVPKTQLENKELQLS